MWTCPKCGRKFRNTNQDHSCMITDLRSHFAGKDQNVINTFEELLDRVMTFSSVRINPLKNAILFSVNSHFLAVKPKKSRLDIEFLLDGKIEGFPIHKSVQATKTKWAHFMQLDSPDEVDDQLMQWLRRAHQLVSS